ncbi:MAG: HAD hydrolase-like protein, partial [Sphaerochaetaceae bacterium]|nr:HAD hydrolase-like protein [Sphaerochaetaceae bacterium]
LKDCFKLTYNLDESLLDKACDLYRGKYEKSGQYEVEIFDGVENVLKQLRDKGYILAIATMKYREIVFSMLEHLDLVKYFEYIDGTNIEGTKYKAQILNEIVEHFNIDKKDSILIGDTDHDKDAAVEAKIDFLAVNYGFGYNKKTKVSKDMIGIASTPKDILSYIL